MNDDVTQEQLNAQIKELRQRIAELLKVQSEQATSHEREHEYADILKDLPDIVYEIDPHGIFTFISNSVKVLGYEPEELIGKHFSTIVHPDDLKSFSRHFVLKDLRGKVTGDEHAPKLFDERRTGKRQTRNLEIRLLPKQREGMVVGTVIAFGDVASVGHYDLDVTHGEKKFLGTLGIIRDVTERKRMEAAMRESERRFKTLTENVNVGIYRNTVGPIGKFIEANPSIVKMFGYANKEEFLSINVADLYQYPEDRKKFNEKMLIAGFVRDEELQLRRKDGTLFFGSVSAVAVKDESGEVKYYDGIIEDITEKKHSEEALRYRLRFEEVVADISTSFINLRYDELDLGLEKALRMMGEFVNVDRSYVFRFNSTCTIMDHTHEWCAQGIGPQKQNLQGLQTRDFPWWMDTLKRHEVIHIPRVADLPAEAHHEKEVLEAQGIQSLIVVPMVYSGILMGFLGFDAVRSERQWSSDVIMLLKIVGEFFANALERRRAEEALRLSEEKYRKFVHQSLQGLLIIKDMRVVFANPAIAEISGYSIEELLNLTSEQVRNVVHPDYQGLVWGRFRERIAGKPVPEHYEFVGVRKDGTMRWLEMFASRIEYEGGYAVQASFLDITERKHAEEALRESEERYRILSEEALVGVYIYSDRERRYLYVNKAFQTITGYSQDELLRMDPNEMVISEDQQIMTEREHAHARGEEVPIEYTVRIRRKNGDIAHVMSRVHPIMYADNKAFLGHSVDITERRHAEESVRESETKFRMTFESARDAIIWFDIETGLIINCNKAAEFLLEKTKKEIIGAHFSMLNPKEKTGQYVSLLKKLKEKKGFAEDEMEVVTKSGKTKYVALTASVAMIGEKLIAQGILRDITERKRQEEELMILATTDALTGVYNRGSGLLLFGKQLQMAKRSNYRLGICYVDVNGLKEINDTYGHQEGDEALKLISKFLKDALRAVDIICRLGGDEFLLVLPQCTHEEATLVWERIAKKVASFNASRIKPYTISLSRGFVEYDPKEEKSVDYLIAVADQEMYKYKHSITPEQ